MSGNLLTYFYIVLCSTYVFPRLQGIRPEKSVRTVVTLSLHVLVLPILGFLLAQALASVSILVIVAASAWLLHAVYPGETSQHLATVIFCYGISYLTFFLSDVAVYLMQSFLPNSDVVPRPVFAILIGVLQLILAFLLFRIPRLKHGFPFIVDYQYGDLGVYISVAILVTASFLGLSEGTHFVYMILAFSILVCGMILWLWWRSRITQKYLNKLKERDLTELNSIVSIQQEEIEQLKAQNEALSKLIHKDNKFLPALDLIVKEFLIDALREEKPDTRIAKTKQLIEQLDQLSEDRAGAVQSYELSHKKLPATGSTAVDAVLSYMLQRAIEAGIDFDLWTSGDAENPVPEEDFTTLLADLLENALITTRDSVRKRILVTIGMAKEGFSLSVFDSGGPFPTEVLENWGIRQITSHADSGGSGIGMMSTHELCRRYHASFVIEEFPPDMLYSKRVTICLDGRSQYRVRLNDSERTEQVLNHPDVVLF